MTASNTDKFRMGARRFTTTIGAGGVADGTTTIIPLTSVSGLPIDTAVDVTIDRVDGSGELTLTKEEVVTGVVSGSNLINCIRGQEGSAQAHSAGSVVEVRLTTKQWDDAIDCFTTEHNQDGTHQSPVVVNYTPSAAATATLTLDAGNRHKIAMPAGDITIALSNEDIGQIFIVEITQDAVGSRDVTWFSGIRWTDGVEPVLTTTADKTDVFGFIVDDSSDYMGFVIGQNL